MKKTMINITSFSLIAIGFLGLAFALNLSMNYAHAIEDNKVITAPISEIIANAKKNANTTFISENSSEIQKPILNFVMSQESTDVPSAKNMNMEEAAYKTAELIKYFMDVDIENGKIEMTFNQNNLSNRGTWNNVATTADQKINFNCLFDSVTGEMLNIERRNNYLITENNDYVSFPDEEEKLKVFKEELIQKEEYKELAEDFIKAKFPDKQIISSENFLAGIIYCNVGYSLADAAEEQETRNEDYYILTQIELSDGTPYTVMVSVNTRKIYWINLIY